MADLKQLREQIDDVDAQLFQLFIQRMHLCDQIAVAKAEQNLSTLDTAREQEKIAQARANVPDDMQDGAEALMHTLMASSRKRQDARRGQDEGAAS